LVLIVVGTNVLLGCSVDSKSIGAAQTIATPDYVLDQQQLYKHIKTLSSDDFGGRKLGSKGNKKAQKYIVHALQELNVPPLGSSFYHNFTYSSLFTDKQGSNIVAVIKGEGNQENRKYIVLSAHFDHIGKSGNSVFNGADDNASGTAALLSLAQQLSIKRPKHDVILLFSDGEESNLKGAKAFINEHTDLVGDIKLNINLDMLAGSKNSRKLHYISRGVKNILSEHQLTRLKDIRNNSAITLRKGFKTATLSGSQRRWVNASDHAIFYKARIPFLYFGVGTHENYHKASDTYENINRPLFLGAVESVYQQFVFIDNNI
jgi:Zn-dependent M28 family amino/carboxypeptidase